MKKQRILIIRLSALGDVWIAMRILRGLPDGLEVDWVVRSDCKKSLFSEIPGLRVIEFDRRAGISGWVKLMYELSNNSYVAGFDLHGTLRSRIARLVFKLFQPDTPWFQSSKQRFRTLLFFVFKKALPKAIRPTGMRKRHVQVFEQAALELKDFKFDASRTHPKDHLLRLEKTSSHLLVMPSSHWKSKTWRTESWKSCLLIVKKRLPAVKIVILGSTKDEESTALFQSLQGHLDGVESYIGKSLSEVSELMKTSLGIVSVDTGMVHLAENVGLPALVLFGPTHSDVGFGPELPSSIALNADVSCSPCSKDGKNCYRILSPYACMTRLSSEHVAQVIVERFLGKGI